MEIFVLWSESDQKGGANSFCSSLVFCMGAMYVCVDWEGGECLMCGNRVNGISRVNSPMYVNKKPEKITTGLCCLNVSFARFYAKIFGKSHFSSALKQQFCMGRERRREKTASSSFFLLLPIRVDPMHAKDWETDVWQCGKLA